MPLVLLKFRVTPWGAPQEPEEAPSSPPSSPHSMSPSLQRCSWVLWCSEALAGASDSSVVSAGASVLAGTVVLISMTVVIHRHSGTHKCYGDHRCCGVQALWCSHALVIRRCTACALPFCSSARTLVHCRANHSEQARSPVCPSMVVPAVGEVLPQWAAQQPADGGVAGGGAVDAAGGAAGGGAPLEAAAEQPSAAADDGGDANSPSSGSSSSDEEDDVAMSEAEGDSSADEDEGQAHASARGRCGQFVWPCPREYPSELQEREAKPDLRPFLCLAVPTDPLQASRPLDPIMAAVDGLIASPLDRGSCDP